MAELTSSEATRQRVVMLIHDVLFAYSPNPASGDYLRAELATMASIGVFEPDEAAFWTRQLDHIEAFVVRDQFANDGTRELARKHLDSIPLESATSEDAFYSATTVYGLGKIVSHRELSRLELERYKDDDEYEQDESEIVPLICKKLIPGSLPYNYGVVVTAIECCERSVVFHWHGLIEEWATSGRLNGNEIELTDDLGTRYSWDGRPFNAELQGELLGSTAFTPAVPGNAPELILRAREVTLMWSLEGK